MSYDSDWHMSTPSEPGISGWNPTDRHNGKPIPNTAAAGPLSPTEVAAGRANRAVWRLNTLGLVAVVVSAVTMWLFRATGAYISGVGLAVIAAVCFVGAVVIDALRP